MRFRCSRCGEHHEGLPDVAFDAPFYFYTVPEAERERGGAPELTAASGGLASVWEQPSET